MHGQRDGLMACDLMNRDLDIWVGSGKPSDLSNMSMSPLILGLLEVFFPCPNSRLEDMEEIYPCTPLQEGMMAETLLDPTANVEQLLDFELLEFRWFWTFVRKLTSSLS